MVLGLRRNGSISKSNRRDQLQARYGQEDAPSVQQGSVKLKGSYASPAARLPMRGERSVWAHE